MNNSIKRGNTKCKLRDLFDLEVEGEDCRKLSLCQEVFWGEGSGETGRKHTFERPHKTIALCNLLL